MNAGNSVLINPVGVHNTRYLLAVISISLMVMGASTYAPVMYSRTALAAAEVSPYLMYQAVSPYSSSSGASAGGYVSLIAGVIVVLAFMPVLFNFTGEATDATDGWATGTNATLVNLIGTMAVIGLVMWIVYAVIQRRGK